MNINKIFGTSINSSKENQSKLRVGQIVEGKILQLYPNNKAQIQLGMQKMIAQLEANLLVGEKYHFQVQATGNIIPLKVIGEPLTSQTKVNAIRLLKHLGLKATKVNTGFVQRLLDSGINFNKSQLIRAFQLLDGKKGDMNVQDILINMFSRKLPITPAVFEALQTVDAVKQTDSIKELLNQLRQSKASPELITQLSKMIEKPADVNTLLTRQIIANNESFFQLFKSLGLINQNISKTEWTSAWESLSDRLNQVTVSQGRNANQALMDSKLPFNLNFNMVQENLKQLNMNRSLLQDQANHLMQTFDNKLNLTISTHTSLAANDFTMIKQELFQRFVPLLGEETARIFIGLENNPKQLAHARTLLYLFSNQKTYSKLENVIAPINMEQAFISSSAKQQFQHQLAQTLLHTGLSYENQITNDQMQQQTTIKEMLIHLLQNNDGAVKEPAAKLLHFINGMQINSVQESADFIQANLQIAGERLGLNEDIALEFESRKTDNGEINPEFCRILFYLDLARLKETVIDMNIQKRSISITILNDVEALKRSVDMLQPLLKKQLEAIDYHLSSVSIKPLTEKSQIKSKLVNYKTDIPNGGVDYRI